jgi:hypothetical protein
LFLFTVQIMIELTNFEASFNLYFDFSYSKDSFMSHMAST